MVRGRTFSFAGLASQKRDCACIELHAGVSPWQVAVLAPRPFHDMDYSDRSNFGSDPADEISEDNCAHGGQHEVGTRRQGLEVLTSMFRCEKLRREVEQRPQEQNDESCQDACDCSQSRHFRQGVGGRYAMPKGFR